MTADDQQHAAEQHELSVAQWLHDQVVPSVIAAGFRVELARTLCPPEADAHLDHAARILDQLASTVRDEMTRRSGHSPSH